MSSPISHSHDLLIRIAYNLRRLRDDAGWTQLHAAEQFGPPMRPNEISRYEQAHVRPSDAKLYRFAEIYGVDLAELFEPVPDGTIENVA